MKRQDKADLIGEMLDELYPEPPIPLDHVDPYTLLVAVALSAQTTDKKVNQVTPALFARYPDAEAYASADREELEEMIRSTGFFRAKTNSLIGLGQELCERHGGDVPGNLADLVKLPGVGRKTANVVLGNAFGVHGPHDSAVVHAYVFIELVQFHILLLMRLDEIVKLEAGNGKDWLAVELCIVEAVQQMDASGA